MIHYTDFITRKPRFTRGIFVRWERGGILNEWGAIVSRHRSTLFIPQYLLSAQIKATLPPIPNDTEEQNNAKV